MNSSHQVLRQYRTAINHQKPLILNITNSVVENFAANTLLALGASPLMSHSIEEIEDLVALAQAVVINIGTLDEHQKALMFATVGTANYFSKPIVIDPVGAGASQLRTETARQLITQAKHAVVKGNAAEIIALAGQNIHSKGVDSKYAASAAFDAAHKLLSETPTVAVVITGAEDHIISEAYCEVIKLGIAMMTRVTGMGCALSGCLAAFMAANEDMFESLVVGMTYWNLSGEQAAKQSNGLGSFSMHFIDSLANLSFEESNKRS